MAYKFDDHKGIVEERLASMYILHIAIVRLLPGQEVPENSTARLSQMNLQTYSQLQLASVSGDMIALSFIAPHSFNRGQFDFQFVNGTIQNFLTILSLKFNFLSDMHVQKQYKKGQCQWYEVSKVSQQLVYRCNWA